MNQRIAEFDPKMTYNAAAEDYDSTSSDFWRYSAVETVRRLNLRDGDHVLDIACGPGPAALAAAETVGRSGRVIGVDIAEEMIGLARRHARERQLGNATFEIGSMDGLRFQEATFSAVTCVFGLFFAQDVAASLADMWRCLRSGGRLGVTTLGTAFFSPMYEQFVEAALLENPDLDVDVPWRRTEDADRMNEYFRDAGIPDVVVEHEISTLSFTSPEDWWRIVMGTGIRRLAMDLSAEALERVRAANTRWMADHHVSSVEFGVIYCRAHK
jgi:SAM-dependent methyltransferase